MVTVSDRVAQTECLGSRLGLNLRIQSSAAVLEGPQCLMRPTRCSEVDHEAAVHFLAPWLDPQYLSTEACRLVRLPHLGVYACRIAQPRQVCLAQLLTGRDGPFEERVIAQKVPTVQHF